MAEVSEKYLAKWQRLCQETRGLYRSGAPWIEIRARVADLLLVGERLIAEVQRLRAENDRLRFYGDNAPALVEERDTTIARLRKELRVLNQSREAHRGIEQRRQEAAAEVERLRAEMERLRALLNAPPDRHGYRPQSGSEEPRPPQGGTGVVRPR